MKACDRLESTAGPYCAVVVDPRIVVTVLRGEHHTGRADRITTGVALVPGHMKDVVGPFRLHVE